MIVLDSDYLGYLYREGSQTSSVLVRIFWCIWNQFPKRY